MTTVNTEQVVGEFTGIGEVAVVDQDDAVGGVDVKRLRLFFVRCCTSSGVADVTEANVTYQGAHVACAETFAHLTLGLVHVQV